MALYVTFQLISDIRLAMSRDNNNQPSEDHFTGYSGNA